MGQRDGRTKNSHDEHILDFMHEVLAFGKEGRVKSLKLERKKKERENREKERNGETWDYRKGEEGAECKIIVEKDYSLTTFIFISFFYGDGEEIR